MATWAATTFCTVSDVRARASDIDKPLADGARGSGDRIIAGKIALAKDLLRQRVLERATEMYPSTVADWISRHIARFDATVAQDSAQYDRWGRDQMLDSPDVPVWSAGAASTIGSSMRPQTFYLNAAPTNGTSGSYAGSAENGAFLADTANSRLYLNQGTLASPTWAAFTPEMVIDYITNPTELKYAAVALTLALLYEGRAAQYSANADESMERHAQWMNHWRKEFETELQRALKLIAVDISNDGVVTEWERGAGRQSRYIF